MSKYLLLLLTFLTFTSAYSQEYNPTIIDLSDSVSIGAAYADEVFYSLSAGVVKTVPLNNWDLSFQTGQNAAIHINGGNGVIAYHIINSDHNSWDEPSTWDTTGLSEDISGNTWFPWINSQETWNIGALNLGKEGFVTDGDFGWGLYSVASHAVLGQTMFLLKLPSGEFKRLFIESLFGGVYIFKFADLDGENESIVEIDKADYPNRNFIYYSIENQEVLDREPASTTWDLLFSKYMGLTKNDNNELVPYVVSGVRTNAGRWVARVETDNPTGVVAPVLNENNYVQNLTAIGHDWKEFNFQEFKWELASNLAFFVTANAIDQNEPTIYRIVFTGFGGSQSGKFIFSPLATSVEDLYNNNEFAINPNIATKGTSLSLSGNIEDISDIQLSDLNGNIIDVKWNSENITLPSNISSGFYFVIVRSNDKILFRKLIVN